MVRQLIYDAEHKMYKLIFSFICKKIPNKTIYFFSNNLKSYTFKPHRFMLFAQIGAVHFSMQTSLTVCKGTVKTVPFIFLYSQLYILCPVHS